MSENSLFFAQSELENRENKSFIVALREYAASIKRHVYVVRSPLAEEKYSYNYTGGLLILAPKKKLFFLNLRNEDSLFEEYVDEFLEDLASLADKYGYREVIGRPKHWQHLAVRTQAISPETAVEQFDSIAVDDPRDQRACDLLISLVTGSINDISRVGKSTPATTLERVKQKIILFDGEQTRFIYQKLKQKRVVIQGLSGTGKTELLLHKLREVYVQTDSSRIIFTCHNRILAAIMRRRIPEFFDFMKVEKQIDWDSRLWCVHAWGSESAINSGTYRYICSQYGLTFRRYSAAMTFDQACRLALDEINQSPDLGQRYIFDYVLLDESQDFPKSFVQLCELVTRERVYVAGDIFQNIFDVGPEEGVQPDFLLNRCYRTDPRTLMFAHALGLGLFEGEKLRWLSDTEWAYCGYLLEKLDNGARYRFRREPVRRFEDLEAENVPSVQLVQCRGGIGFSNAAVECVFKEIAAIIDDHPATQADDIAVIFIDYNNDAYAMSDLLAIEVPQRFGWQVNQAYTSKDRAPGKLFVSNINNVKGLEFPFVICVVREIRGWKRQRNSLYMALTRSFLKSILVVQGENSSGALSQLIAGLGEIMDGNCMTVDVPHAVPGPSTITLNEKNLSLSEMTQNIFDELDIDQSMQPQLRKLASTTFSDDYNVGDLEEFISTNSQLLRKRKV